MPGTACLGGRCPLGQSEFDDLFMTIEMSSYFHRRPSATPRPEAIVTVEKRDIAASSAMPSAAKYTAESDDFVALYKRHAILKSKSSYIAGNKEISTLIRNVILFH